MLDPSIPVTAHAVLRYMTRVLKLKLTPVADRHQRTSTRSLLAEASAAHGLDLVSLQRTICPEHLEAAVRGGASRIGTGAYSLICRGGVVVTLIERHQRPSKTKSEKELRHMRGRIERRRRSGTKGQRRDDGGRNGAP